MSRPDPPRGTWPSPWEVSGLLAYVAALIVGLGAGLIESLRYPEYATVLLPVACLAIHWDDQRRAVARHAMPLARVAPAGIVDPLWDREIDG